MVYIIRINGCSNEHYLIGWTICYLNDNKIKQGNKMATIVKINWDANRELDLLAISRIKAQLLRWKTANDPEGYKDLKDEVIITELHPQTRQFGTLLNILKNGGVPFQAVTNVDVAAFAEAAWRAAGVNPMQQELAL